MLEKLDQEFNVNFAIWKIFRAKYLECLLN